MLFHTLCFTVTALQIPLLKPLWNGLPQLPQLPTETAALLKDHVVFARAAYCIDGLQQWNCSVCEADAAVQNITFAGEFASTVFAYVGYSLPRKTIVLAFRGTRTLNGWIRDLRFALPDCPFDLAPEGAKVHLGFLEAWNFLKPAIELAFLELVAAYPHSSLLITGHSLGGAVATLAAVDLYSAYFSLPISNRWTVLTVGQPRVGNQIFSNWTDLFPLDFYRVVYENDLVPHLPPGFVGFQHVSQEVWVHEQDLYTCSRPLDKDRGECTDCANSVPYYSIPAHQMLWDDKRIGIGACFLPELSPEH
ncbi:hypothetical protein HDV03_002216 [Kappamyces sp. JEL0829]|nr:hypothetical protein HDV03_002216 [Kappamyces sp. JEL0829]